MVHEGAGSLARVASLLVTSGPLFAEVIEPRHPPFPITRRTTLRSSQTPCFCGPVLERSPFCGVSRSGSAPLLRTLDDQMRLPLPTRPGPAAPATCYRACRLLTQIQPTHPSSHAGGTLSGAL
ncbi:hypothetical protein K523DRAFT_123731 [Schizophyllum commune Tattone D]|nr:hypothetical protein K523DRAFT_123731 [Schizophyllum commune Tattone D]